MTATPGNNRITLDWSAPSDNGGRSITGYRVQYKERSAASFTNEPHSGTGTSNTIIGLTNGATYDVQVAAINVVGTSEYTISAAVPRRVPDAPTNLNLNGYGDERITAIWDPPDDNGGNPISNYVVQYKLSSGRR